MTDPRVEPRRARARRAREAPRRERPFPPMIEYAALAGWPTPVRFVLATAALPLEVVVTGVRVLKDVEVLLAELGGQLRALRPAVEALGEAYADGFVPVVDTVGDLADDVGVDPRRVGGLVLAPVTMVRDALFGEEPAAPPPEPPAPEPPAPAETWAEWARRRSGSWFRSDDG